uniref:Serpentine receptor class gamma n=1 Tax=Steinernema glaseri TaxID=37863 RepID=A0A1I8ANF9_9BILA
MNDTSEESCTECEDTYQPDGRFLTAVIITNGFSIIFSIPVSFITIFFSFTKVPQSLARTYILNMSVVVLIDQCYTVVYDISLQRIPKADFLSTISYFLPCLSINVYYYQATLTVALSYLSFARPLLAKNFIGER